MQFSNLSGQNNFKLVDLPNQSVKLEGKFIVNLQCSSGEFIQNK